MFDTTYLGHQGWLIETATTHILVDPVLADRTVGTADDPLAMYPPRRVDLAAFPPIDAVVVTHEHPDHVNLPTLLRLDRSIPIHLPARASTAVRGLLAELGFRWHPMRSGDVISVGDLEIHPYHCNDITLDEWDVTPLVIRDRAGEGSLATLIDAPEADAFACFAVERAGRVGLWVLSHNRMDLFPTRAGARQERDEEATANLAREFIGRFERSFRSLPRPETLLVLSMGLALVGDLAWMNRHVFPGEARHLAPILAEQLRDVLVRAPQPGHRFSLCRGKLIGEDLWRPFLATIDPREWPPHAAEPFHGAAPDYAPAIGRRDFTAADLDALLDELRTFAGHLYGGALMRSLYVGIGGSGERADGVAFSLRTDAERIVLAYGPEACAFERVRCDDPRSAFTAGFECWAGDLLSVLRLEIYAGCVLLGRCRMWNAAPDRLGGDLASELLLYTHPLRFPGRALERYRRVAATLAASVGPHRVAAARASVA